MTHERYESKSQMKRIEILKAGEKQMTHEELLAKIKPALHRPEFCANCACGAEFKEMYKLNMHIEEANNVYIFALRAVVELPIEDNSKPDSFNMNFANRSPNEIAAQCFQWGYATAMNKVIKTIEKELQ